MRAGMWVQADTSWVRADTWVGPYVCIPTVLSTDPCLRLHASPRHLPRRVRTHGSAQFQSCRQAYAGRHVGRPGLVYGSIRQTSYELLLPTQPEISGGC